MPCFLSLKVIIKFLINTYTHFQKKKSTKDFRTEKHFKIVAFKKEIFFKLNINKKKRLLE